MAALLCASAGTAPTAHLSPDGGLRFSRNGRGVTKKVRFYYMKANLFIVGAPKCGTSAMTQYLAAHPDIYMARKEMHFFGQDLRFGPQFYRRDLKAYLGEFQDWNGQRWAAEASVWYLFSTSAAREIKEFNPDARIIIMLRKPSEMLHSLYHQFSYDGNEHLPSFEEALRAQDDRRAGRRLNPQTYLAQGLVYHDTVRYTEQVRRYFDAFGRDNVKVILFDDFVADVPAIYRETLEFLGLEQSPTPAEFKVVNPAKKVRSHFLRAILNSPRIRSAALAARPCIPRWVLSGLQRLEAGLRQSNTRNMRCSPLSPELRAQLDGEFAHEVERLGQLLGCDLTHWNKGADVTGENERHNTRDAENAPVYELSESLNSSEFA